MLKNNDKTATCKPDQRPAAATGEAGSPETATPSTIPAETVRAALTQTSGMIVAAALADNGLGFDLAVNVARTLMPHLGEAIDGKPAFAVVIPQPGGSLVQVGESRTWCQGFVAGRPTDEMQLFIDLGQAADLAREMW